MTWDWKVGYTQHMGDSISPEGKGKNTKSGDLLLHGILGKLA